ncbi:hypothetical protein PVL29_006359 [Vitis rotundifolia]|uniref:Uncharacterized protein n=1 Tax=Vitis rotundifolia TaxID=103349 RepID=A0AA39DYS8_VITRO|nr:hypothetical protein PVL29_006359 [Vitis rotundifolia]
MNVELAAAIWPAKIIYDSTPTAIGIPNAPALAAHWPVEIMDDSSPTGMRMLDSLVEVAAP